MHLPSTRFVGFPKEGLSFLDNIIINNSKEWLDEHKEEYEKYIVTPNKAYVEEMGEHLQILVPHIHAIPKINTATVGEILDVKLERPRHRLELADDPEYNHYRAAVLSFLYEKQRKPDEAAAQPEKNEKKAKSNNPAQKVLNTKLQDAEQRGEEAA